MTLSAIRSDIGINLPTNYHSTILDDDKKDEFINHFMRRVCRAHNFEWMKQELTRNTADGTQKYLLPTAGDANWSELESGTVLRHKEPFDAWLLNSASFILLLTKRFKKSITNDSKFQDATAGGVPTEWAVDQDYFWIFKIPEHASNDATAFVMHYVFYGFLADMSADGDTNWLVANIPELLEYGATALCYRLGLDYEQEALWESKAAALLAEIIKNDIEKKTSAMEEGMKPGSGQSLGDHTYGHGVRVYW